MNIKTAYDIGESVKIKNIRTNERIVTADIIRISIHRTCHAESGFLVRYTMEYTSGGEVFYTDRWEEDLIKEDLTCSAMPKLLIVVPSKEAHA